ncbi:hypothetical protein B0T24DRAFT_252735 [Lasiosphaeria ovina]|uniref:Uncharacterized protein n=1 Tax=Lasiosphaeria ovina TaxID=92902 RepID=A0AAE0KC48_9PEZI|nr:hypothetical protein B0T24DRAFT_252735 [Lasiosphaeria ovina]
MAFPAPTNHECVLFLASLLQFGSQTERRREKKRLTLKPKLPKLGPASLGSSPPLASRRRSAPVASTRQALASLPRLRVKSNANDPRTGCTALVWRRFTGGSAGFLSYPCRFPILGYQATSYVPSSSVTGPVGLLVARFHDMSHYPSQQLPLTGAGLGLPSTFSHTKSH